MLMKEKSPEKFLAQILKILGYCKLLFYKWPETCLLKDGHLEVMFVRNDPTLLVPTSCARGHKS